MSLYNINYFFGSIEDDEQIGNKKRVLSVAVEYEDVFGKEVQNWNSSEILNFLMEKYATTSIKTLAVYVCYLRQYANFMINQGNTIDGQNHFDEVTTGLLGSYINKRQVKKNFFYVEDVYEMVDEINNPRDKYIMLAAFEGFSNRQILFLKKQNVYPDHVEVEGKSINISKKLYYVILDCADENIYYKKDDRRVDLEETDYVYKFHKTSDLRDREHMSDIQIKNTIHRSFFNINKTYGYDISSNVLNASFRFNEMKEYSESLGIPMKDLFITEGGNELLRKFVREKGKQISSYLKCNIRQYYEYYADFM